MRFRLTAYFIIFALILMGMLWFFQTVFLEQYYESEMEKKIQTAVSSLSLQYSVSETLDLESYLQEIGTISNANDMYFFIEAEDESFNISSTDQGSAGRYYYGRSGVDLARERLLANNGEPVTFKISNQTGEVVTQVYAAKVDSQYRPNVRFYAFAPLTPMGPAVGILAKQLLTVTAISLVVAGILALYISSRIARPITGITKQAAELAEGHYDVEFEGSSYREINDLAGTLNTTAVLDRVTGKGQYHVRVATEIWKKHPIFGVGGWGYKHYCLQYMTDKELRHVQIVGGANVHNDYLQFLAEHGVVGFGLIIAIILMIVWPIGKIWKDLISAYRFTPPKDQPPQPMQIFVVPAPVFCIVMAAIATLIHAFGDCVLRSPAILSLFIVSLATIDGFLPRIKRERRH